MTNTSLEQKCGVVIVVVIVVVVCVYMIYMVPDNTPASQPADIDVVQELIDSINYSLLHGEYDLNNATTEELIENIKMLQ